MEERNQIITYLIAKCDEKNAKIAELQAKIDEALKAAKGNQDVS